MTFQLVNASEDTIVVWQTEQGHVYIFTVDTAADCLSQRFVREAPEAAEPATAFADEAFRFATEEARMRKLIGVVRKRRWRSGGSCITA